MISQTCHAVTYMRHRNMHVGKVAELKDELAHADTAHKRERDRRRAAEAQVRGIFWHGIT